MRTLHTVALVLTIVGGINWGLIGLLNLDLVTVLVGGLGLTGIVHILMGVAAVVLLVDMMKAHHVTT